MKKSKGTLMRLIYVAGIALVCATLGLADTITLKNGRVINGTFLGGTARTVRIDDGVNVRTLDVSDIVRIEFSGGSVENSSRNSGGYSNGPTLRRAPSSSSSDSSSGPTLRRADTSSSSDSSSGPTLRRADSSSSSDPD